MRTTTVVLYLAISVIALCVCICATITVSWVNYSPATYPLQQAERLLTDFRTPRNPIRTPRISGFYSNPDLINCLQRLADAVVENGGVYEIAVEAIYGQYGTRVPFPAEHDWVNLNIVFPDGRQQEIEFENGMLGRCIEPVIPSNDE